MLGNIEKLREFSRWFDGIRATESVDGEGTTYIILNYPFAEGMSSAGDDIRSIADEIEREHAQRVAGLTGDLCSYEWRNKELKDALKAICNRFGVSSTKLSAEDAAKKVLETLERDYMELPVDADGVPIRVGEDVVRTNDRLQPETVCIIGIGGRSVFFKHDGRIKQNVAHNLHHVKPRTIEDVLLSRQRREIVRCRDCQSWFRGKCRKHVFTTTVDGTEYDEGAFSMDASDFCSLGELRGDA